MTRLYTKDATILQRVITSKAIRDIMIESQIASNQNNPASLAMRDAIIVHAALKSESLGASGKLFTHCI
jgi:hypothetical protein